MTYDKPSLFLSQSKRLWFRLLATVGASCSLVAAISRTSTGSWDLWIIWISAIISVLFLYIAVTAATQIERCTFCLKPRAEVKMLVAGDHSAICDECTALTVSVVCSEHERYKDRTAIYRMFIESLPRNAPFALSTALLSALVEEDQTLEVRREAARRSFDFSNAKLCIDLLSVIPEKERSEEDLVNLGAALGRLGRYDEALKITNTATAMSDAERPLCLNNAAWFQIRKQPDASKDDIAQWIAQVDEAKRLLGDLEAYKRDYILSNCLGTEAELRIALGDLEGAGTALEELKKLGPLTGRQLLIRARLQIKAGKPVSAKLDLQQALEVLHRESLDAEEARGLQSQVVSVG